MGLAKTVALIVVAGAAGSMIAAMAAPKVVEFTKLDAKYAGALNTGLTAGSTALVYIVLASAL